MTDATSKRAAIDRYKDGEITAEEYLRLIRKETAAIVRREQRVRRMWGRL